MRYAITATTAVTNVHQSTSGITILTGRFLSVDQLVRSYVMYAVNHNSAPYPAAINRDCFSIAGWVVKNSITHVYNT